MIFDSEFESEGAALKAEFKAFVTNCEDLNFNIFPTDYHSMENYTTQRVIKMELGLDYVALSKYENFSSRPKENKWGKTLNWKMFMEMTISELDGSALEAIIKNTLVPLTVNNADD